MTLPEPPAAELHLLSDIHEDRLHRARLNNEQGSERKIDIAIHY